MKASPILTADFYTWALSSPSTIECIFGAVVGLAVDGRTMDLALGAATGFFFGISFSGIRSTLDLSVMKSSVSILV